MDKLTDILAGRALTPSEEAILPDQAARTMRGIMEHPLLRKPDETPGLAATNPEDDLL